MKKFASDAAPSAASMRPGLPQANHQHLPSRPPFSQTGRPAPGSISRSEAGVSVDLSAASNTAANGEDPMDFVQQGRGVEQRPRPRAKSSEADKWFEDSNRNASTRGNVSFVDDDPPFHIPSQTPNDIPMRGLPVRSGPAFRPPSFLQMPSQQSSGSEEFRSVIDDLTVENKKLRKENRQLRRLQTTHTHPDKLFEVRMHGLDARDKKRLMNMLRDFNESLARSQTQQPPFFRKYHSKGSTKPSSSSTLHSNSNPVDSAYASGSTSGNASGSQAAESRTVGASEATRSRARRKEKDQNVRSYLMNTRGLLPQQPPVMTEKTRKKMVVKKMEQLFTGRPNTAKKNSQSQQQQQVSTEAAKEFKRQTEAVGRTVPAEGSREAMIHPNASYAERGQGDHMDASPTNNQESAVGTPDQRPTRPLDLDISRAQNPAENIAYIRHLGFKTSNPSGTVPVQASAGGVWIPLNLLMNLAQLHMINVTPDFVRQALNEISEKFEISSNGTKVRWKGGVEGTRMSGGSGSSAGSKENSPSDQVHDASGARLQSPSRSRSSKPSTSEQAAGALKSGGRTDPQSGNQSGSRDVSASTGLESSNVPRGAKRPIFLGSVSRDDSFSYHPIFLHGGNVEEEADYFLDEDDSLLSSGLREDTTGSGSGQRSRKRLMPDKEEGAIIFYQRARFCTDLSGDHDIVPVNTTQYVRVTGGGQVGAQVTRGPSTFEPKGLLSQPIVNDQTPEVDFSDLAPVELVDLQGTSSDPKQPVLTDPYIFAISGLGHTSPSDNFALWPKYQRMTRPRTKPALNACRKFIRNRFFDEPSRQYLPRVENLQVALKPLDCVKRELPPSLFPSPGFYNQWSSSESTEDLSDSEDEEDSKSEANNELDLMNVMPTFGNTLFHSHSGEESEDEQDNEGDGDEAMEDDESDDVPDMLAYARQQDAEETARREREWEEQVAAGSDDDGDGESKRSSAATVGDRSFLSDEARSSPGRGNLLAGQKRERDEPGHAESSPAKRVETSRAKAGKK